MAKVREDGAIIPQFWHYEMHNTLLVAERRGRVPVGGASGLLYALEGLDIFTDQNADLHSAMNLARVHALSFYDALYLELAKRLECSLATLDGALSRAARAEGLEVVSI